MLSTLAAFIINNFLIYCLMFINAVVEVTLIILQYHSSGYLVATKLKTFPTMGILDSANKKTNFYLLKK